MQSTHVSHSEARSVHVKFVELNSKVQVLLAAQAFFGEVNGGEIAF